jgi:hypothetical protein
MVAWVVMNRHHLPRSPWRPRKSRLPRALGAKGSIRALPLLARLFNIPAFKPSNVQTCFPLSPAFSSDYEMQISQPLSLDIDTKCPGVYAPLFASRSFSMFGRPPLPCVRTYPLSFQTLANSFASIKNSTLLFSTNSELFAEKHPGWGEGGTNC